MTDIYNEVLGREVKIPESPERIISLSPALTETLFMLGLGDKVIGVSAFCARPEAARGKRKVGSYSTTSNDLLRGMNPDLVVAITGYQRDLALRLSQEFPSYPITLPVSVAGIVDTVVKLGLVVGRVDQARDLSSALIRSLGSAKPLENRLSAYVEIDLGGPVSFGACSYITDALHMLGASSLFGEVRSEWLTPDLGKVVSENPDVIIYEAKMYAKFGTLDLDRLMEKRQWGSLDAVRNGSCFLTPGPLDFLAHHGPSFITEALPWLSERLSTAAAKGSVRPSPT
jgi:iron complex transport system substrate-binding protein